INVLDRSQDLFRSQAKRFGNFCIVPITVLQIVDDVINSDARARNTRAAIFVDDGCVHKASLPSAKPRRQHTGCWVATPLVFSQRHPSSVQGSTRLSCLTARVVGMSRTDSWTAILPFSPTQENRNLVSRCAEIRRQQRGHGGTHYGGGAA